MKKKNCAPMLSHIKAITLNYTRDDLGTAMMYNVIIKDKREWTKKMVTFGRSFLLEDVEIHFSVVRAAQMFVVLNKRNPQIWEEHEMGKIWLRDFNSTNSVWKLEIFFYSHSQSGTGKWQRGRTIASTSVFLFIAHPTATMNAVAVVTYWPKCLCGSRMLMKNGPKIVKSCQRIKGFLAKSINFILQYTLESLSQFSIQCDIFMNFLFFLN